jgi:hypothetical protein
LWDLASKRERENTEIEEESEIVHKEKMATASEMKNR